MRREDCACDLDGEWWGCTGGSVYGPCEYGTEEGDEGSCGGYCEYKGECRHSCHGVTLARDTARPFGARR